MLKNTDLYTRVKTIIKLHDAPDFQQLSSFISNSEIESGSWFTEERFHEVCSEINNKLGGFETLEHITTLKRKSSSLTLWKARYSSNDDEVLWQIVFNADNEITLMHINWEHT